MSCQVTASPSCNSLQAMVPAPRSSRNRIHDSRSEALRNCGIRFGGGFDIDRLDHYLKCSRLFVAEQDADGVHLGRIQSSSSHNPPKRCGDQLAHWNPDIDPLILAGLKFSTVRKCHASPRYIGIESVFSAIAFDSQDDGVPLFQAKLCRS